MATIDLANKDSKVVSFEEFEQILNTVGMNWYGLNEWSGHDLCLFEAKYDGFTCEPTDGGMKIWNRNFDYSPLYKKYSL